MSDSTRLARLDETRVTIGILSGAHLVNHMYLIMLPPLLGELAATFDASLTQLGLALGVLGVVGALIQLPYGYLSDNHNRLIGVGINKVFGAIGAGVIALAPSFPWVIIGSAIMGLGIAGHETIHYPMIIQTTSEEHRGRSFSVYEFSGHLGFMITPAIITGILASGLGWRYAVGGLSFLGFGYTLFAVGFLWLGGDEAAYRPINTTEPSTETVLDRIWTTVQDLIKTPSILSLAMFTFLMTVAKWGVVSYVVVLLTDGYGVSLNAANVLLTGMFIFSGMWILYGGVIIDKIARGPDTVMAGSFGLAAPLVAILGTIAIPVAVAAAIVLLIGAAQGPTQPAIGSITGILSQEENLGRNMAIITIGTYTGNGVAPPVIGAIIDAGGLRPAFFLIAIVGLISAFLMVGISHRYSTRRTYTS